MKKKCNILIHCIILYSWGMFFTYSNADLLTAVYTTANYSTSSNEHDLKLLLICCFWQVETHKLSKQSRPNLVLKLKDQYMCCVRTWRCHLEIPEVPFSALPLFSTPRFVHCFLFLVLTLIVIKV